MEGLFQIENIIALVTLVVLELVLGVDNVIFISILAGKLPVEQQSRARMTGIALAVLTRIALLLSLSWIIGLEEPFFSIPWFNNESLGFSGRDVIMLAGGMFLLWKATHEIHQKLEGVEGQASARVKAAFWSVIIQIMLLDIVFSLDSVITAVGMVDELLIMIIAVIVAAGARGRCSLIDCSPCSRRTQSMPIAGSLIQKPGWPRTTAIVGSAARSFS